MKRNTVNRKSSSSSNRQLNRDLGSFPYQIQPEKSPVNEKVPFSFAGRKDAGTDAWPGRKLKGTRVELKRNEAFGYAF